MNPKYIAVYVLAAVYLTTVESGIIKAHPNGKGLTEGNVNHIKNIFVNGRHKRDLPLEEEEPKSQDAAAPLEEYQTTPSKTPSLPDEEINSRIDAAAPLEENQTTLSKTPSLPEEEINSRIGLIPTPLSIFDSLLNFLKKMLFAATDPIIKAARDFVLGFFDVTITGLVTFTKKSEPPGLFASIVAHTLNCFIKRGVDFLVYVRETVRYFFNMFISSSNKRSARAVNDPTRNFLLNFLNMVIGNLNAVTGGAFLQELALLQRGFTNLVNQIFPIT